MERRNMTLMTGQKEAHVALLRGINLGGKNRLSMKDLAAIFSDAGCRTVETYIQSGNVVFAAPATLARRIPGLVEKSIEKRFGLVVPVMTRTARELRKVATGNPFLRSGADTVNTPRRVSRGSAFRGRNQGPGSRPLPTRRFRGERPRGLSSLSEWLRSHQAHERLLRLQARHHQHGAQLEDCDYPARAHLVVV